jgi:predicted nucleic acid-binding protein
VKSSFSLPSQIVVDASAFVELLAQTSLAPKIERVIGDAELVAPDVLNVEVLQSLRGLERGGRLTSARASLAVLQLARSKVQRMPTVDLLPQVWSLRANVSAYDACYVALARALDCPLLTIDGPLTRAPKLGVALISV